MILYKNINESSFYNLKFNKPIKYEIINKKKNEKKKNTINQEMKRFKF